MKQMDLVTIDEKIAVLAAFAEGKLTPLRFRWQGRTFHVNHLNGQWQERDGVATTRHYSVQVGADTYFLCYHERELQWSLDQVVPGNG